MTKFRLVAPFAIAALILTACPAGDGGNGGNGGDGSPGAGGGSITVTSLWGGAEAEAFEAVLTAFEEETGITAEYQPQRQDYATVLNNRIAQGDPPDVAIIPGIGFLRSFARDDLLVPLSELGVELSEIEGDYPPGLLEVGVVDGEFYGLMVKANSKATIWYHPTSFSDLGVEPPGSFEDLLAVTDAYKDAGETPWAVGAGDSWTLTDWFEIVYLKQAGEEAYDTLFSAEGDWTDQSVKDAISTMTEIINEDNVAGGINGALATGFVDGIGLAFSESNDAWMYYEGGFVGGIALGDVNPDLEIGTDIDFFDFPTIDGGGEGAVTIGGDVIAAFTDDPGVAEFMQFMASAEAGQVWAEQGTIISPLTAVDTGVYPTELTVKEAEQIKNASVVRFDGSDLLPAGTDLGAVLQTAIQDPSGVDGALEQFQSEVDAAWEDAGG